MEIPRLAADAAEIHRDLPMPHLVARFDAAATMPTDTFARSYGIRLAVVGSSRLQARELDHGLVLGHQAIDTLTRLASSRWRHERIPPSRAELLRMTPSRK